MTQEHTFLSESLQLLLGALMIVVEQHPQHALPPLFRQKIYHECGPRKEEYGRRRRGWLAVLAAHYVLPIWQSACPDDPLAADILDVAERSLQGKIDQAVVRAEATRHWDMFFDEYLLQFPDIGEEPWFVLKAVVEALLSCADWGRLETIAIEAAETDADIDPWSSDAASTAAAAYAGPVWRADSNTVLRLEYWRWWLGTAIPTAWQLADAPVVT